MFLSHRRGVRGYLAISRGLIAVGAGDARAAKRAADEAHRIAPGEPLALAARRAIRAAFRRPRRGRARVPRDGRARRHQASGPARPLHRGAAAQGSCRGARLCGSCRERRARARLGRPGGAGIPLRLSRLDRRAGGARPQLPLWPDRQGATTAGQRAVLLTARALAAEETDRDTRAHARARRAEACADARAGSRARRCAC